MLEFLTLLTLAIICFLFVLIFILLTSIKFVSVMKCLLEQFCLVLLIVFDENQCVGLFL